MSIYILYLMCLRLLILLYYRQCGCSCWSTYWDLGICWWAKLSEDCNPWKCFQQLHIKPDFRILGKILEVDIDLPMCLWLLFGWNILWFLHVMLTIDIWWLTNKLHENGHVMSLRCKVICTKCVLLIVFRQDVWYFWLYNIILTKYIFYINVYYWKMQ